MWYARNSLSLALSESTDLHSNDRSPLPSPLFPFHPQFLLWLAGLPLHSGGGGPLCTGAAKGNSGAGQTGQRRHTDTSAGGTHCHHISKRRALSCTTPTSHPLLFCPPLLPFTPCLQVAKETVGQESRHIVELCTQLFVKCCHGNKYTSARIVNTHTHHVILL